MGINIILPLIIGMALMVSLGSQVVPSFVEQMKVAKIENRTISNQNLIKDAIVRYIKMEKKVPKTLEELKTSGLLKDYHESNLFNGGYSFTIDKKKGTLKIFTKIDDKDAGKYFSNSFKFPNKPNCVELEGDSCKNGEWETFYLLDEDTFKSILPPEVGSKEDILDRFTEDNIGNKKDKDGKDIVFGVGDKDNFLKDNKDGTFTIIEKEKQPDGKWSITGKETTISGNNIGKETGVFISNLDIPYHEWNETEKKLVPNTYTQEKVHCKDTTLSDTEVLVINENTGLGELVWVAPSTDSVSAIKTKIFTNNYTPNNICTSNVERMVLMFHEATNFNQPLKFDTSNVTSMVSMFSNAKKFNNGCIDGDKSCSLTWNTSKVTIMVSMFEYATSFTQPLDFDTSNVTSIRSMFSYASLFNQPIGNWNVSNVTDMEWMFNGATIVNQNLSGWCVSKIPNIPNRFDTYTNWTEPQPKWGKAKVIETINENGSIRNSKCQIEQNNGKCNVYDLINQNSLLESDVLCQ